MYCQFYAVGFSVPSPVTAISRSIARSRNLRHSRVRVLYKKKFVKIRRGARRRRLYLPVPTAAGSRAAGSPLVGKNKPHVRSKILMRCYCFCESYRQLETFQTDQYVLEHESGLLCCICKHNQFSLKKSLLTLLRILPKLIVKE